ncbi:MAG: hypothetical protein M3010_04100, partial [Candidatus Dormibacteraeota bacterium]|nr:hypothetical protein [Candidatus Dormibacteraeota bacterium]
MRNKGALRYLFPAVFAVLAMTALVVAQIFQAHMLGTGGSEVSLAPATVPSVGPASPSPTAPPVAVVPSPAASSPEATSPAATAAPSPTTSAAASAAPTANSAATPGPATSGAAPSPATSGTSGSSGTTAGASPSPAAVAEAPAALVSPLSGTLKVSTPGDDFPFCALLVIASILGLIFCAIWLMYSRAPKPVAVVATPPARPVPPGRPAGPTAAPAAGAA